jgi:AcrR family transcriptional regulator
MASSQQPALRRTEKTQRRKEILAAAFEEFSTNGYAATRLDDVARRAGIAKGTVFLHFRNKKLLFRSVVRHMIHPVLGEIEAFISTYAGSAEVLLRDLLSRPYAEVVRSEKARGIIRLLIAEARNFPQLSDIYDREIIQPGMKAICLSLEKGIAAGEFRRTAAAEFPQILVAPMVLAVVWTLINGERRPLDLDAYMAAHLDFALAGLRRTAGPQMSGDQATSSKEEIQ